MKVVEEFWTMGACDISMVLAPDDDDERVRRHSATSKVIPCVLFRRTEMEKILAKIKWLLLKHFEVSHSRAK